MGSPMTCPGCQRPAGIVYRTAPVGDAPAGWLCRECHPDPPKRDQFDRDLDAALRGEDGEPEPYPNTKDAIELRRRLDGMGR